MEAATTTDRSARASWRRTTGGELLSELLGTFVLICFGDERRGDGREVRLGQPAVVLAEVAADCDAEPIVVGSRGRGAWRSAALGSVSSEVARRAPCPVMIVPEHAAGEARTA